MKIKTEKLMDKNGDVLIIGGGINGCGIAAEAQTRGLSVILCEKGDLSQGTSSKSSKLIHGGLRYLEQGQLGLVRKALKERETLFKICPHLIHPLQFVLPYSKRMRPFWLLRLGLFIYDHLTTTSVLKTKVIKRHEKSPFFIPLKSEYQKGLQYFDAFTDDARLVISNALQAKAHGADILTRTTLVKTRRENCYWVSDVKDNQKTYQIKSKILINATGPWVESLNNTLGIQSPYQMSLVKGTHLVFPKLYEGKHAYILQSNDTRIVFAIPYYDKYTLVGTTESSFSKDLDTIFPTNHEKTYLCKLINRYFKKHIQVSDILESFSGVRPLVSEKNKNVSETSRDYIIHLDDNGAPLLSIFSGKLTTYRKLAVDSVTKLKPYFKQLKPSISQTLPLPGGEFNSLDELIISQRERFPWLPDSLLRRYVLTYGLRMNIFLENCDSLSSLGPHFGGSLYQKELDYLKKYEWAVTADDILKRRTKLFLTLNNKEIIQLEKELSTHP